MTYYYESELYHHGIKGQKWGVRRYQNEDGTLTELGKKRYDIGRDLQNKTFAELDSIPESPYEKERKKWLTKHHNADESEFEDEWFVRDDDKKKEIEKEQEEWSSKYSEKERRLLKQQQEVYEVSDPKGVLDANRFESVIGATILTMPLSAIISYKATKNVESGMKRAGIILASIGGTAVGTLLAGEIAGRVRNRKLDKKYGIK